MPSKSEVEIVLNKYGSLLVKGIKENMQKPTLRQGTKGAYYSAPISSGKLLNSVKFEVKYFGKYWKFTMLAEDYFEALDKGRGGAKDTSPKFLNSSIYNWVVRKGLTMDGRLSKKKLSQVTNLDAQRRSLAFLIKRKINRSGFKGYGFYQKFKKEHNWLNDFQKELSVAFGKEIVLDLEDIKKQLQVSK